MTIPTQQSPGSPERPYVVLKRGLFWRPEDRGYTSNIAEAGRYTREEAESRCHGGEDAVTMELASKYEPPANAGEPTEAAELAFDYGVRKDGSIWSSYGTFPGPDRHCMGDINWPLWAHADLKRRLDHGAAVSRECDGWKVKCSEAQMEVYKAKCDTEGLRAERDAAIDREHATTERLIKTEAERDALRSALKESHRELGEIAGELADVVAEDAQEMATPSLRINHRLNSVRQTLTITNTALAAHKTP